MSNIAVEKYKGIKVDKVKNMGTDKRSESLIKDAIMERLLDVNDIDIPLDLVDEEVNVMLIEYNHRMKYESMASGGSYGFDQDDLDEQIEIFREEAFKMVKTRLILEAIIEVENIEVTKQELEDEAKAIADRQHMPFEMVKDFLGENLDALIGDLLIKKAIEYVCKNAVVE